MEASPVRVVQDLLNELDPLLRFFLQQDQRQLSQQVVKPIQGLWSGMLPSLISTPRVMLVVHPGDARLAQGFAMPPIEQWLGPRVHVPGVDFLESQQPSVTEHPAGAGADNDQAWGNRAVRKQPVLNDLCGGLP
jgi:hypothetical protein